MSREGKLTFKVCDEKIEFILAKLLKYSSLRDSCCLVDLLSGCVQENPPESHSTSKLEKNLLEGIKVEKVDTQAKGYEEALGEKVIPTNQGINVSFKEHGKSKDNKAHLRPNKNESKEKKKLKEKFREKPYQKYEPPHWSKRKEESCMTWMYRVSWVLSMAKGHIKGSNLKEAPS